MNFEVVIEYSDKSVAKFKWWAPSWFGILIKAEGFQSGGSKIKSITLLD